MTFRFLVALALTLGLQPAPAIAADPGRPPKACAAARNRVVQQQKAIADIEARRAAAQPLGASAEAPPADVAERERSGP